LLVRGVPMAQLLAYWGGDERGSDFAGPRGDFPYCVPIATQCTHAAGVASAMRLRSEKRVAVCFVGDGGTSKGDFYEALNLAGVWRLPLVFVITNNQWAISVPLAKQTACATLAQKAVAGGVPGEQVDGNDLLAVRQVMARALARARRGDGPSVIEAMTYRLGDHTTSDDARRYRPESEVSAAWQRDPLPRLRAFMAAQGTWSAADEERLIADCNAQVEAAVAAYLATPPPAPTDMFDHLYAQLPASLAAQRAELAGGAHG
jgi:pyruvate dehydrogenase E1 component alpha subunit